jgi:quinol monooxygenase YgiN
MYVVTVLFTLKPEHAAAFLQAVIHNAETSLANEPGCRQFDVCVVDKQPNEIFLYELYDSKGAFDKHLGAEHFLKFNAQTATWVNTKAVHTFVRVSPRG